MARFLALDWDHQQLHVVLATVGGGAVRVKQVAVFAEPQTPNPAEAEALGKKLRERLKEAGIAPAPVLACIGRDRVILKDLRHPPVPPAEEPNLVRFQALKELTEPPDEVVLDYTPAGPGPSGDRRALVLVVRRELLETYQALCQAAGLKLAGLTPRPFGLAACLKRVAATPLLSLPPATGDVHAVVAVAERWAEFCVVKGDTLVYARSLTAGPGLPGEIRRNLALYAGQAPQQPISAVYLAGTAEQSDLRQRIQDLLGVPVHLFDPFAGTAPPNLPTAGRGGFAGALGLLCAQATTGLPINFVKVKQGVAADQPRRRMAVLVAGFVAALALGGGALYWSELSRLDREISLRTAAKAQLDTQLSALEESDKRTKAVGDWADTEVVWLDELYDLTDRVGSTDDVRLVQVTGGPLPRTAKSKQVAKLEIKGITKDDPKPVNHLMDELAKDPHFRVEPKAMGRNVSSDRLLFAQQFTTRVDIARQPATEYKRRLPDPAPPAPRGRDKQPGTDQDPGFFGEAP